VNALRSQLLARRLRRIQRADVRCLARLARSHPGLSIHPDASTNLARARFELEAGARVSIGPGVVTERRGDGLCIHVRSGGRLEIGAGTWLRTDLSPVLLYVYKGARMEIGADCFLNGCQLSAKTGITLGRHSWVGPGSRIWDSDQHALDDRRPECSEAVQIGDHVWVAADVSVLRGVCIGDHSVVGTRSLVTHSIPEHTLAFGSPAVPRGTLGDRSEVPI